MSWGPYISCQFLSKDKILNIVLEGLLGRIEDIKWINQIEMAENPILINFLLKKFKFREIKILIIRVNKIDNFK